MGRKQRAIKLNLDRTFDEKNFSGDVGKIYEEKNAEVQYEPVCVFSENKPKWVFWRSARHLIFFVEGALKALQFGKTTEKLQTHWTKKESRTFVFKQITKALQEFKPMKWIQFILIFILLFVIIMILLRIAFVVGAL